MSRQRFPCLDREGKDKRLGVTTEFDLRQRISCRDRVFYVATEFGQNQGLFLSRQRIFMSLCRDRIFFFFVAIELWPSPKCFLSRQYIFRLQQSLAKTKGFHVATKYFVS